MKFIEIHMRIMNIKKIMKFHMKFYASINQNNENHENYRIPIKNNENHENPKTLCWNKTK